MKEIHIFKTNVNTKKQAKAVFDILLNTFPNFIINFDLEDCDKILRIETEKINNQKIISILNKHGFNCAILSD